MRRLTFYLVMQLILYMASSTVIPGQNKSSMLQVGMGATGSMCMVATT